MANNFTLILDTTSPSSPSIQIESGATYATAQLVNLAIGTGDGTTTGYQMKIWGSVDDSYDTNIQSTEGASTWMTYSTTKQIKLSAGDGSKTVNLKIRDDVYNESSQASDSITLNTAVPIVSITGPDVSKISKNSGKNACSFSFTSDTAFVEYKIKVVGSVGAVESTGATIVTTNGSTNMAGTGSYNAATPISSIINGTDYELTSSGDGSKIVKIFVKSAAGIWSV